MYINLHIELSFLCLEKGIIPFRMTLQFSLFKSKYFINLHVNVIALRQNYHLQPSTRTLRQRLGSEWEMPRAPCESIICREII